MVHSHQDFAHSALSHLCLGQFLQVVFSPLFVMKSHLPDPVIVHIEKRSLALRESQLIHGQGHLEPLLNTEADITHHLLFQAR